MGKLFTTKKRIVIAGAAAAVVVAGGAGAAYAYFGASGTGTGNATVATVAGWNVSAGTGTTPLSPGNNEDVDFTVTNKSGQTLTLSPSDVTWNIVESSGGYIEDSSGNTAVGCNWGWFNQGPVSVGATTTSLGTTPITVAANGTATVSLEVDMPTDSTDNQDACEGVTGPALSMTLK